jgi:hypothetical protein
MPTDQQTVRIIQLAVVEAEGRYSAYARSRRMQRKPRMPSMWATGRRGEQAASFVDPDMKNGGASVGDKIGVAIAIDVGDNESDDRVSGV